MVDGCRGGKTCRFGHHWYILEVRSLSELLLDVVVGFGLSAAGDLPSHHQGGILNGVTDYTKQASDTASAPRFLPGVREGMLPIIRRR